MRSMSTQRMRAVDHWLGIPLCAALGVVAKAFRVVHRRQRQIPEKPRRILVMKFFGLGSVIQASPMLRAIRGRYPQAKLIFLTFEGTAAAVERMGVCDQVSYLRTDGALRFVADVVRQILRLAYARPELCIDLEFFSKFSTLMSVLSGSPVRVAFHLNSFWRSSLVTHPVYYNYYRHISDAYNEAARAIGAPVTDLRPLRLACTVEETARCRDKLRAAGWDGAERLVGVNVNAGDLSLERRWPGEKFAMLLERLAGRPGVRAVMTGAPDEVEYVAGVFERLEPSAAARVINLAGKLSFAELVASMDLYDFFVTNDSGPLHLAYAQGRDTISLWGVGRPSFYGPLLGNHSTFYQHLACSPCLYMFTSEIGQWCDHRADCMRAIEVDEVWATICAYLDNTGEARTRATIRQGW